jgi:signal transduction histidine kinase
MIRSVPRQLLTDAGLALLLIAITGVPMISVHYLGGDKGAAGYPDAPVPFWWLASAVIVVGLLLRQRRPYLALLLALAGVVAHQLTAGKASPLDLALPVVVYSAAALAPSRRIALAAVSVATAAVYVAIQIGPVVGVPQQIAQKAQIEGKEAAARQAAVKTDAGLEGTVIKVHEQLLHPVSARMLETAGGALQEMLLLVAAFAIGDAMRSRRAHLAAVQRRTADLAREERQRAALAVAAERARITRELHDVVAHGMSVMVVQAQGAAAALERRPDRAATALRHVIATGRSSLAEMRRLLAAEGTDEAEDVQLTPQPGIGTVPALVDQLRSAGMPIQLHVDGVPASLPASVDLSAYRIVQEALTNTLKHAGPGAGAVVRLAFDPDRLLVEVTDDGGRRPGGRDRPGNGAEPPGTGRNGEAAGAGPSTAGAGLPGGGQDGSGNGLRGIAERVAMLGGALESGQGPGGGFRLCATLPLCEATPVQR